jgi:hypothetical protein
MLEANLTKRSDMVEPQLLVEGDAGFIREGRSTNRNMQALRT